MANSAHAAAPENRASTDDDDQRDVIAAIASNLTRLNNGPLLRQRVALSQKQTEQMRMLAVGAKLERALQRRMTSQDAEMRPRGNRGGDDHAAPHVLLQQHKEELSSEPVLG